MPKKDGTGPQGYDPKTGRGRGTCDCCSRSRGKSLSKDEARAALEVDVRDLEKELATAKKRLDKSKS